MRSSSASHSPLKPSGVTLTDFHLIPLRVTDGAGLVYDYTYTIKFFAPQGKNGFYIVNLTADDAAGDGWAFDMPNGATGGYSGDIAFGDAILTFKGGLLMGVTQ